MLSKSALKMLNLTTK